MLMNNPHHNLTVDELSKITKLSGERLTEILISGLYTQGILTREAIMQLLQQTRREFNEMLYRNSIPLSSPETSEDVEELQELFRRKGL
jgi:predicted HTH domain antitoxin